MLIYVTSNYRPYIAFEVHHCDRFTHNFKHSHEKCILHIIKYLQGTRKYGKHEGLIIYASKKMQINCYVDAEFYGLYVQNYHHYPVCVWSRTGYVITFYDWAIMWLSKFQNEVALSTIHSEYVDLSKLMRDFFL